MKDIFYIILFGILLGWVILLGPEPELDPYYGEI
jgi:hypothetical protein